MGPSKWMGQLDGMVPGEVPYSRIWAFMQATPRSQRRRLADGSLVIGQWRFWRKEGVR